MLNRLFVSILLSALALYGQAAPSPPFKQALFDNNGLPLVGGQVWSFAAGTSTPLATYTDSTGGTANPNPVVLDSAGRANIWLSGVAYKIVVKTSAGVTLYTVDNILAPGMQTSITIPSGATFTLASGSTASIATSLIPAVTLTNALGSSTRRWLKLWVGDIDAAGDILPGTAATYNLGSNSLPWLGVYGTNVYADSFRPKGALGNWFLDTTFTATNNYIDLKDDAGNLMARWSKKESSVLTGNYLSYLHHLPAVDATKDLGSITKRWRDLWIQRQIYAPIISVYNDGSASQWSFINGEAADHMKLIDNAGNRVIEWDRGLNQTHFSTGISPYPGFSGSLGYIANPWAAAVIDNAMIKTVQYLTTTVNCATASDGTSWYEVATDTLWICQTGVAKAH